MKSGEVEKGRGVLKWSGRSEQQRWSSEAVMSGPGNPQLQRSRTRADLDKTRTTTDGAEQDETSRTSGLQDVETPVSSQCWNIPAGLLLSIALPTSASGAETGSRATTCDGPTGEVRVPRLLLRCAASARWHSEYRKSWGRLRHLFKAFERESFQK